MIRLLAAFAGCALAATAPAQTPQAARVFAAASLTNALTDIGSAWQRAGHPAPVLDFAASGTLAKQIDAGAPADLFASADTKWMDFLAQHNRIDPGSRRNLLSTALVLIAPNGVQPHVEMRKDFAIGAAFTGKLCTGEPGVVPVGIYAQQALQSLGWWDGLKDRIVGTDDVRNALAFVERGECQLGIVYATDALISDKVHVVAQFPEDSHPPIVYPVALISGADADAKALLDYLSTPAATDVFKHYGFTVLPH